MKCMPLGSEIVKNLNGLYRWYKAGSYIRQSFNDQPSYKTQTDFYWYRNSRLHRDYGKPAVIKSGVESWFVDGDRVKMECINRNI